MQVGIIFLLAQYGYPLVPPERYEKVYVDVISHWRTSRNTGTNEVLIWQELKKMVLISIILSVEMLKKIDAYWMSDRQQLRFV